MDTLFRIAHGVGQRMKEERQRLDLTQEEMARRLGISRGTYLSHEKELYPMDVPVLARMPDAGVDLRYVLTGKRSVTEIQQGIPADAFHAAREALKQHLLKSNTKLDPPAIDALLLGIAVSHARPATFLESTNAKRSRTNTRARKAG